ncbi:hypothetical protein AOLI_G00154990 [Acnodon oligacanthus]
MKQLVTLMLVYMLFSEALQGSAALRCYECPGPTCDPKPVTCTPPADTCQSTTIEVSGLKGTVKGCVPKAVCDATVLMKCCDTDLCNSAEGVKLSLLIMLVPLISSTLFI